MERLHYLHTEHIMAPHVHGTHLKDMMVLHETVSPNLTGLRDIIGVENYLAGLDYGIHDMNDAEGNIAHAYGLGDAIFYHAGGVNERACGLEQVSIIPALIENHKITMEHAFNMWMSQPKQLVATAKIISAWHNTDPKNRPLIRSNGLHPGVCSHWDVSQHFKASLGHWDCRPADKGGYYPLNHVIAMAKGYSHYGYHF